jgi:hypothetical protein
MDAYDHYCPIHTTSTLWARAQVRTNIDIGILPTSRTGVLLPHSYTFL